MKKIILLLIFILSINFVSAYTIDYVNNNVYIDTAQVKILVSPHTLSNSGCSYINITNKNNNGLYDLVVGSDANASVSSVGLWSNNGTNSSWYFKQQNISTIYLNHSNKTVWYETNGIQMNKNIDLYLEMCMNIVSGSSGKYDVGAHLTSQTLVQSISGGTLLLLDPWWNSTLEQQSNATTNCTLNGWTSINNGSSTVKYDYNGKLRISFTNETNMTAYWKFEDNLKDEKCNWDATMIGTAVNYVSNGFLNKGVYGFTSTSYIKIPITSFTTKTPITVNAWVKWNASVTANNHYITYIGGNPGTTNDPIIMLYYANTSGSGFWSVGVWRWGEPGYGCSYYSNVTINKWYMATLLYNGVNNRSLWVDGIQRCSEGTSGTTSIASRNMEIGFNLGNNEGPMDGIMDEFVIFNYNLSGQQILDMYNNGSYRINNKTNNMFYSTSINQSILDNSSYFYINLTSNDNNSLVRVSSNNGTNWTSWYSSDNNIQNLQLPVINISNILIFQINLTSGNATYSPKVSSFGMKLGTIPEIYSIIGQTLYNTSIIANSRLFLYNDNDIYLANTTSNSTGWYNFANLINGTKYIISSRFSNSTTHYIKSKYFNIISNTTNGTIDYYSSGTGSNIYYVGTTCLNYAQGYYFNQYNNGCYQVSNINICS